MTDLSNPVIGAELGNEFDVGVQEPGKITLNLGPSFTRNPDGTFNIVNLPPEIVAGILAQVPVPDATTGVDVHVQALGFDPGDEVLTLTLSDQTQVRGVLDGVVTEQQLALQGVTPRSVFGADLGWRALPIT